jgi:hypothetical protein
MWIHFATQETDEFCLEMTPFFFLKYDPFFWERSKWPDMPFLPSRAEDEPKIASLDLVVPRAGKQIQTPCFLR